MQPKVRPAVRQQARGASKHEPEKRQSLMFLVRLIWSRFTLMLLLCAALAAIIGFYGVTPYNAWQEQRGTIAEVRTQLDDATRANAELKEEIDRLSTPAEVERVARRDHNLIYPGEQAYVVLPPATSAPAASVPTASAPASAPASVPSR